MNAISGHNPLSVHNSDGGFDAPCQPAPFPVDQKDRLGEYYRCGGREGPAVSKQAVSR
jgi:hypothetical protein